MRPLRDPDQHRPRADWSTSSALIEALHRGHDRRRRPRRDRPRAARRRRSAAAGPEPDRAPAHRLGDPHRTRPYGRHGGREPAGRRSRDGRCPIRSRRRDCASPSSTSARTRPACYIADVQDGRIDALSSSGRTKVTRLGAGVDADGRLHAEAMQRVYDTLDGLRRADRRHRRDTARRRADQRRPRRGQRRGVRRRASRTGRRSSRTS